MFVSRLVSHTVPCVRFLAMVSRVNVGSHAGWAAVKSKISTRSIATTTNDSRSIGEQMVVTTSPISQDIALNAKGEMDQQEQQPQHQQQQPQQQEVVTLTPSMSAFVSRTGLEFFNNSTFLQAITHSSYRGGKIAHNEKLEIIGLKILELFTAELMHTKYPHIPADGLNDLVLAYTSECALTELGKQLGLQDIVRWQPESPDKLKFAEVLARSTAALVGGFYHDRGIVACRKFVHAVLLSQKIDMKTVVEIPEPRRTLIALLRRKKMEAPICRLLHETGRFSTAPIFVVGVFSHLSKLGEGVGTSLRMAETKAYKDALYKYFLFDLGCPTLPSEAAELPPEEQFMYRGADLGDTPYMAERPSSGMLSTRIVRKNAAPVKLS